MNNVAIIDLYPATITCCICGKIELNRWGVPVSAETALICANDFDGDWGTKPACKECWEKHDAGHFIGHDPKY
jgi:hypothetical protein